MFLNVSLSAGAGDATAPKTPEILNSLISLTSPPLPPTYAHYQGGTAGLLSPNCSTPGDECGGGGWGGVGDTIGGSGGVESGNTNPHNPNNNIASTPQQQHQHQYGSVMYPSSSLLTPTSDGSSPPPSHYPPPGGGPPLLQELASPVSTVEATRSALIKEGLKLQITTKLQQTGVGQGDVLVTEAGAVVKTELTPEDEERRRRRRERNKVAATKCRNKKKEMTEILVSESETVEEMNVRLKGEVERLNTEKDRLENFLNDIRHRSSCNYIRRSTPSVAPKLTVSSPSDHQPSPSHTNSPAYGSPSSSSSSCCSSSSPCSFSSLLSPSDSKEFFAHLLPPPSTTNNNNNINTSNNNSAATSSATSYSEDDGFGSVSVASTAGSLECIEPTIPLDTASTTKVITSKRKASSSRYHPYMYTGPHSTQSSLRQDAIFNNNNTSNNNTNNNNYPSTSSQCVSGSPSSEDYAPQLTSTTDTRGNYCSAGVVASSCSADVNNYSCSTSNNTVTVDTKTNPFKYPYRHPSAPQLQVHHHQQQQQHHQQQHPQQQTEMSTSLEAASNVDTRSEYRRGKATLPRYSPYSVQQSPRHHDLGPPVAGRATAPAAVGVGCSSAVGGDAITTAVVGGSMATTSCGGYSNSCAPVTSSHLNPFFPPCTYSSL